MSSNEIFDSIKKSTKSAYDKIDKQAVLYLDEMVTPKLVTFFYWILLFAFITKGIGDMFEGSRLSLPYSVLVTALSLWVYQLYMDCLGPAGSMAPDLSNSG